VSDDLRRQLPDEVVDELLAGARTEEEIVGPGGLLSQLTKRLVERALEVELTDHLGYERHQEPPGGTGNQRNGSTAKTLVTEHGPVPGDSPAPPRFKTLARTTRSTSRLVGMTLLSSDAYTVGRTLPRTKTERDAENLR
jgi:hypothetical protein